MREQTRPWTSTDVATLRKHSHLGAEAVAVLLNRSVRAVQQAAHRHRITLRRTGSRRGTLLGQPRGASWKQNAIRQAALAGELDLTEAEAQIARIATGNVRPLCVNCCEREQDRPTGLCTPCHLRALAEQHRNAKVTADAFRDYELARQQKHRRKEQE